MPKIDFASAPQGSGSTYPDPFHLPCQNRSFHRLGVAAGLTQFGVNLVRLAPGAWSSQRHWHSHEDEYIHVLEGHVVLVTNRGEEQLVAGDAAGFKAGNDDAHHFQNRSQNDVLLLVVGSRSNDDQSVYPDIDLAVSPGRYSGPPRGYSHKDGSPYQTPKK